MDTIEDRLARIESAVAKAVQSDQQRQIEDQNAAQRRQLIAAANKIEAAVKEAEEQLAEAYDMGEGADIAKAQRALTEAVNKQEAFKARLEAAQNRGQSHDTTNLNAWKQKHADWYGVDQEMTKAAHEIDRQIREAGVISVGSQEYFNAVDRKMSERFPGRVQMGQYGSGGGGGQTSGAGGRIDRNTVEAWRKMGINVDDPKVVERMLKNRQRAVQKGILGHTPVSGPVKT